MKIRPIHDRVAVKRSSPEKTSKGGIIIPDAAQEQVTEGTVIAVGTGVLTSRGDLVPLTVKVGDRVIIAKYGGHVAKVESDEIVFLREDEIHAILEP